MNGPFIGHEQAHIPRKRLWLGPGGVPGAGGERACRSRL